MKLRVRVKTKNDIKYYSPDTNWASLIVEVKEIMEESQNHTVNVLVQMMDTIKAAGIISFEPKAKGEYIIMGEYEKDEKWGWQFKIDGGYENIKLDTLEEKRLFLEQILTERQVESLFNTFEDPFQYIE